MHPAYLKARMDDLRAREAVAGFPTAREDRIAILGALADLGMPENAYVRDPSRPRQALYLYRDEHGRPELGYAPWRLARHAPPGMAPADVRRVGRDLRRGITWSASGVVLACLAALIAFLVARSLVPPAAPDSVSPAAYLHAAPVILGCVALLCAVAAVCHLFAFLSPRAVLAEDEQTRQAYASELDRRARRATPAATGRPRGAAPEGRTAPRRSQDPSQAQER